MMQVHIMQAALPFWIKPFTMVGWTIYQLIGLVNAVQCKEMKAEQETGYQKEQKTAFLSTATHTLAAERA